MPRPTHPYLRAPVRGSFYYLYLLEDLYGRRIVGWQVLEQESADDAARLVERTCVELDVDSSGLHLHSDNGGPMKGATMLATLQRARCRRFIQQATRERRQSVSRITFSYAQVSTRFPNRPFRDIEEARQWVTGFVRWYNQEHLHSALNFVTPEDRYFGRDTAILAARHMVYQRARRRHPERWSGETRNWSPAPAVTLNPSRVIGST